MVAARSRGIPYFFLVPLLTVCIARAQIIENIQTGIEDLARGMDYVGRRAGEMLGSGISLSEGDSATAVAQRTFDEQYSLGPAPTILLSNEFGEVRVNVWNERLVRISASIIVGADTSASAEQVAELIEISVTQGLDYLECRSQFPDITGGDKVSMAVNYQILVPRDAGLSVENFFGDVHVAGLGGSLTAEVQYGGLELSQIAGTVRAQVVGDFHVNATGLKQGGLFKLQNASADFSDFQGEMSVQHFRGTVTFRRPAPQSSVVLSSDSGRAQIFLPPNADPDVNATLSYGKFESELEVTRQVRGQQLLARRPNVNADQRILINATFSDVSIEMEGNTSETVTLPAGNFKAFTDVLTENIPISEDNSMVIVAIPGNIHIEGVDEDQVALSATRVVWTPSAAAGMDALEALHLETEQKPGVIQLTTSARESMAAFGCESYRVDLNVQVPNTMPITVQAAEGITTVIKVDAGGNLEQDKGEVVIENSGGAFKVANNTGAVTLKNCGGSAEINTRYGTTTIEQLKGDLLVNAEEGHTYVDAPGGNVTIRSKRGDVRLLSLEPVKGNYDILVEEGGLNAFINPDSDVSVTIKTNRGRVQSALPLTGSIKQDVQEFFGRINEGTYTLRLESRSGDVILN